MRAVNDGWVERVRASGVGYGRAVYLRLADGRTVVYGHLSRFAPRLDAYVAARQECAGVYEQDLVALPQGEIRFARGEIVAWSGQSGAGPPHLHFEVRRGDTNFDPLLHGYALPDHIAPTLAAAWITPHGAHARVGGGVAPVRVALPAGRARVTAPPVAARSTSRSTRGTAPTAGRTSSPPTASRRGSTARAGVRGRDRLVLVGHHGRGRARLRLRGHARAATTRGARWRCCRATASSVVRQGPAVWSLAPGTHRIELTAADEAGNRASATLARDGGGFDGGGRSPDRRGGRSRRTCPGASPPGWVLGACGSQRRPLYLTSAAGAPAPRRRFRPSPRRTRCASGARMTRVYDLSQQTYEPWQVATWSNPRAQLRAGSRGWHDLGVFARRGVVPTASAAARRTLLLGDPTCGSHFVDAHVLRTDAPAALAAGRRGRWVDRCRGRVVSGRRRRARARGRVSLVLARPSRSRRASRFSAPGRGWQFIAPPDPRAVRGLDPPARHIRGVRRHRPPVIAARRALLSRWRRRRARRRRHDFGRDSLPPRAFRSAYGTAFGSRAEGPGDLRRRPPRAVRVRPGGGPPQLVSARAGPRPGRTTCASRPWIAAAIVLCALSPLVVD